MTWFLLAVLAALAVYAVGVYNSLVSVKHGVGKAWANIDVLLKQRHDEIPKLVEVCKQYRQFEADTLEKVIKARARVDDARSRRDMDSLGSAEAAMRGSLGRLFAVAEAYPELKADQHFAQLQSRISQLENAIADRRELYNDAVNINNVRIEQFPDTLVARFGSFPAARLLEFDAAEKADVDMKALFS